MIRKQTIIPDEQLAQLTPEQAEMLLSQMPALEDTDDMELLFLRIDLEAIAKGSRINVGHGPYQVRYLEAAS